MEGYWETRNGKILKISEMTTIHIERCLSMLEDRAVRVVNRCMSRNEEWDNDNPLFNKIEEFYDELRKREGN